MEKKKKYTSYKATIGLTYASNPDTESLVPRFVPLELFPQGMTRSSSDKTNLPS